VTHCNLLTLLQHVSALRIIRSLVLTCCMTLLSTMFMTILEVCMTWICKGNCWSSLTWHR